MTIFNHLQNTVLPFIDSCKIPDKNAGHYKYSSSSTKETLYSSTYAAMTYSLLGLLADINIEEKKAWADYINSFQEDDGLYRDPVIFGEGWYAEDPLWCGRSHLTCHVFIALGCLGHTVAKPMSFLNPFKNKNNIIEWLENSNYSDTVHFTGNEVMNIGMLLQYARDYHGDIEAGEAVKIILDWLATHYINPETGVWGNLDINDPYNRSVAVQAAYHFWPLFIYDKYPIPFMESAIDTVLLTQNPSGGFGWCVKNPDMSYNSSCCEDIDSIDPLIKLTKLTGYRKNDVINTLIKAKNHVLSNQTPDGGFSTSKGTESGYGHHELCSKINEGAMFPAWFRSLTLALIDTFFCECENQPSPYIFINLPGYQYY